MRFIFIVLFLVSFGPVSMGGVGDVYFCNNEFDEYIDVKEKKTGSVELGKFKFKIELEKIVIKYPSGKTEELIFSLGPSSNGTFVAISEGVPFIVVFFEPPIFNYSFNSPTWQRMYSANCSKF